MIEEAMEIQQSRIQEMVKQVMEERRSDAESGVGDESTISEQVVTEEGSRESSKWLPAKEEVERGVQE